MNEDEGSCWDRIKVSLRKIERELSELRPLGVRFFEAYNETVLSGSMNLEGKVSSSVALVEADSG